LVDRQIRCDLAYEGDALGEIRGRPGRPERALDHVLGQVLRVDGADAPPAKGLPYGVTNLGARKVGGVRRRIGHGVSLLFP
jgi:hypothetical protein